MRHSTNLERIPIQPKRDALWWLDLIFAVAGFGIPGTKLHRISYARCRNLFHLNALEIVPRCDRVLMTMSVDKYRRHAVDCLRIAEGVPDSQNRMLLIDMAQSWLLLAQEADKSLATDVVVETPLLPGEASRPIVMQQQQQTQPKKEE